MIEIINGDAITELTKLWLDYKRRYDLAFLDPPYFDWSAKAGYRWSLPEDLKPINYAKLAGLLNVLTDKIILFGNQPMLNDVWKFFSPYFHLSFSLIATKNGYAHEHPVTPAEDRIIMRGHEEIWIAYRITKRFSEVFKPFKIDSVIKAPLSKYEYELAHPTVKSLALTELLIQTFTEEGVWILDPFFGTGTTGVACKVLNRNCTGIEIRKEYVDIAKNRINQSLDKFL